MLHKTELNFQAPYTETYFVRLHFSNFNIKCQLVCTSKHFYRTYLETDSGNDVIGESFVKCRFVWPHLSITNRCLLLARDDVGKNLHAVFHVVWQDCSAVTRPAAHELSIGWTQCNSMLYMSVGCNLPFQYFTVVSMHLGVRCISFGGRILQRRLSIVLTDVPMYHNSVW